MSIKMSQAAEWQFMNFYNHNTYLMIIFYLKNDLLVLLSVSYLFFMWSPDYYWKLTVLYGYLLWLKLLEDMCSKQ